MAGSSSAAAAASPPNGFFVYPHPQVLEQSPISGPANGGTLVEVIVPSGRLDGATPGAAHAEHNRYGCAFGHAIRSGSDGMLIFGRAGVVPASRHSETRLRCTSPSAEAAGAGDYVTPLSTMPLDSTLLSAHGAARVGEAARYEAARRETAMQ